MHGSPRLPLLLASLGTSLACAAPGLNDTHVAVTYGYGASLMCQSLIFSVTRTAWPSAGAMLLLLVYLLYGIKMCVFQRLRDTAPGYVSKVLQPARDEAAWRLHRRRTASGSARRLPPRLPFVLSFGVLLSAFSFPLSSAVTASPRRALGVALGALTSLCGLVLQSVADGQKFNFKRERGADELCTRGLWTLSRHPNYLAEMIFHAGLMLAGLAGARKLSSAFLSVLAPTVFIWIMQGATARLEMKQLAFYEAGDLDTRNQWRDYVRRTPRLFGQLASPSDPTYLAVEERQDQENRGDEIAGIMAITGGAGVATAVVGFIGWLLIS